jgi:hypothetical protein
MKKYFFILFGLLLTVNIFGQQDSITYQNKSNPVPVVNRPQQATAEDFNEIKSVINNNAGDVHNKHNALLDSLDGKADTADVFSGDYNDLTNQPTIPTDNSELTNGAAYMDSATYDPQGVEGDVFDRSNMTGTQGISTVSGLQDSLDKKLDPYIFTNVIKFEGANGIDVSNFNDGSWEVPDSGSLSFGLYLYQDNGFPSGSSAPTLLTFQDKVGSTSNGYVVLDDNQLVFALFGGTDEVYIGIENLDSTYLDIEITWTSVSNVTVKVNNEEVSHITNGHPASYFNDPSIGYGLGYLNNATVFDINIFGNHKYKGFPNGNTTEGWVDLIGTSNGTVSGTIATTNVQTNSVDTNMVIGLEEFVESRITSVTPSTVPDSLLVSSSNTLTLAGDSLLGDSLNASFKTVNVNDSIIVGSTTIKDDTIKSGPLYFDLGASSGGGGTFDRGTVYPTLTNRLNYNGDLHATSFRLNGTALRLFTTTNSNIYNLSFSSPTLSLSYLTSKTDGAFYTGTSDPTNLTRLNYDGSLYATFMRLDSLGFADGSVITGVDTSGITSNDTIIANNQLKTEGELIVDDDTVTGGGGAQTFIESYDYDSLTITQPIRWNASEGVHEFVTGQSGVVWQGALEDLFQFYNNTGGTIANGTPLYYSGVNGDSILTCDYATAAIDFTVLRYAGMATGDVPNNSWGFGNVRGKVREINTSSLSQIGAVFLGTDSLPTMTKPAYPNKVLILGGVIKVDAVDGILYHDPSLALERQLKTKSYTFTSQGISSGQYWIAGFYDYPATDANLTQASTTITYGTADIAYEAHPFIVAGGAGTVDAGQVGLRVTGTAVFDDGTQSSGYADTIITDITTMSLNDYTEAVKFLGTVTYELITISGSPTTYSFDFNYGYAKYDDIGDRDFYITGLECIWQGGTSDATGFDIELLHHKNTGWTYSAAAFEAGNGAIAQRSVDQASYLRVALGTQSAWKRTDLNTFIDGAGGIEGFIWRINTGANNTAQNLNLHIEVALD